MNWQQWLAANPESIINEFGPGTERQPQIRQGHKRLHKYNAQKTESDSRTFDSKAEARRYEELRLLEEAGEISDLKLQPRYELQKAFTDAQGRKHRAVYYVGDFEYVENGQIVCIDVKGFPTPLFRLKWKLAIKRYRNIEFRIVER